MCFAACVYLPILLQTRPKPVFYPKLHPLQTRFVSLRLQVWRMSTGSLGALTTTFTPAPTCLGSSVMWLEHVGQGGGDYYVQLGPPWTRYPSCLPPNYLPVSTSYYSPGICPSGYTAACSSTVVEDNQQVTAEVCCPK